MQRKMIMEDVRMFLTNAFRIVFHPVLGEAVGLQMRPTQQEASPLVDICLSSTLMTINGDTASTYQTQTGCCASTEIIVSAGINTSFKVMFQI